MSAVIKPRRGRDGTKMRDLPDVLQPKDIARFLGVSRSTVSEMMRRGALPAVPLTPHRFVVAKSNLIAYLEKKHDRD
jgi:excisionase family DNA binding protein